ncbi:MAG: McrC family protein [Pseudomonadota bacterium]
MAEIVVVREYARLTVQPGYRSLDWHSISDSAFQYLCKLSAGFTRRGAKLLQMEDRLSLQLDSFVGVIETPCGTILEILPKHADHADDADWARGLLQRMLPCALDLATRDVGTASITPFRSPLSEWVMAQFLKSLDHLVKRGLRFDYVRVEEEQRFLRGQVDVVRQMRQPPGRQHFFQIRHDIFSPDRPENRLLRSALDKVCKHTQEAGNWRLAHELASLLAEIPASTNQPRDFRAWRKDRLMAHYQPVKPWCELVLGEHMPLALRGSCYGISMLFPMEKLFERYVAKRLETCLIGGAALNEQVRQKSLCNHKGKDFFQLKPDLLLTHQGKNWVLDTKWKRLDGVLRSYGDEGAQKYGLKQSDFYQLFAYGHKYLEGEGDVVLIYPVTKEFDAMLPVFNFSPKMNLWVVPFHLDDGKLLHGNLWLPMTSSIAVDENASEAC